MINKIKKLFTKRRFFFTGVIIYIVFVVALAIVEFLAGEATMAVKDATIAVWAGLFLSMYSLVLSYEELISENQKTISRSIEIIDKAIKRNIKLVKEMNEEEGKFIN